MGKTAFKKSGCGNYFVIEIFIVLLNLKTGVFLCISNIEWTSSNCLPIRAIEFIFMQKCLINL